MFRYSQDSNSTNAHSTASPIYFIFLTGASGSGKTTIAANLQNSFNKKDVNNEKGIRATIISSDNYSLKKEERTNKQSGGDIPEAYDLPLLQKHLLALQNGEAINTRTYDMGTNTYSPELVQIDPKQLDVVIVEGIFALYGDIPSSIIHKTTLFVESDSYLSIVKRRSERDAIHRNTTPDETIKRELKEGVRNGFFKYILPLKPSVDYVITNNSQEDIEANICEIMPILLQKQKAVAGLNTLQSQQTDVVKMNWN